MRLITGGMPNVVVEGSMPFAMSEMMRPTNLSYVHQHCGVKLLATSRAVLEHCMA